MEPTNPSFSQERNVENTAGGDLPKPSAPGGSRSKTPNPISQKSEDLRTRINDGVKEILSTPNFGPPPATPSDRIQSRHLFTLSSETSAKIKEMKSIVKTTLAWASNPPENKQVRFEDKVKHRITLGEKEEKEYFKIELEQELPLIDESQDISTPSRDQMTVLEAELNLDMEKMRISIWKRLPKEFRPKGTNPVGLRTDHTKTEKVLSSREDAKIRKANNTPSWLENISHLEEKAYARMKAEGVALNKINLFRVMFLESHISEELTLDDLKYLYCQIFITSLYVSKEDPGTPLDLVEKLEISEKDLISSLTTNLNVTSISRNKDGNFILRYITVPEKEVLEHVLAADIPDR